MTFDRLAVAVVDEQHRFGVNQRRALDRKAPEGLAPHVLHMTATPIPRTLALTAYGDLDVTVLRHLPAGRQPIHTHVASTERERARAYERIREELRAGRQAFVVCPLVEESEALQARAATAEYERLRTTELRDFRVVLLHGQMKPREKQEAMAAFAAGGADVLVATTVIEVGIDVPNASVMLVEGAERYGISQLHQLRGRIGRGTHESVCVLFGPKESPRLRALAEFRDGFKLAEIDLELRGEGEMLGTRQSGLAQFRVARLPEDAELLDGARRIGVGAARGRPGARRARARAARVGGPQRLRRRRARPDPGLVVRALERGPQPAHHPRVAQHALARRRSRAAGPRPRTRGARRAPRAPSLPVSTVSSMRRRPSQRSARSSSAASSAVPMPWPWSRVDDGEPEVGGVPLPAAAHGQPAPAGDLAVEHGDEAVLVRATASRSRSLVPRERPARQPVRGLDHAGLAGDPPQRLGVGGRRGAELEHAADDACSEWSLGRGQHRLGGAGGFERERQRRTLAPIGRPSDVGLAHAGQRRKRRPSRRPRDVDVPVSLLAHDARDRGDIRRPPAAGAAGRGHAADLGPRPRGAVLHPRRPRRRRAGARSLRRLGRARARGAQPRRRVGDRSWTARPPRSGRVQANLAALGAEAEVVRADALRWLRGAPAGARQYDLVFLDPPYRRAGELGAPLSAALAPVLAEGALVVAEADRRAPLELTITATDERRYGDTLIRLHAP